MRRSRAGRPVTGCIGSVYLIGQAVEADQGRVKYDAERLLDNHDEICFSSGIALRGPHENSTVRRGRHHGRSLQLPDEDEGSRRNERKALAGVITRRCVEQGYTEKSPEFVPCIKAETEGETARRRRARLHSELMAIATQRVTCVKISGVMRCN
jgi:hypothetical protein